MFLPSSATENEPAKFRYTKHFGDVQSVRSIQSLQSVQSLCRSGGICKVWGLSNHAGALGGLMLWKVQSLQTRLSNLPMKLPGIRQVVGGFYH